MPVSDLVQATGQRPKQERADRFEPAPVTAFSPFKQSTDKHRKGTKIRIFPAKAIRYLGRGMPQLA
jgi:hypothetical protein